MSLASSSQWLVAMRSAPRVVLYGAVVVLSALGFVALTHGKGLGVSGTAGAYAESIRHSVAPLALGRVEQVLVHVGQRVKAGEPLAIMRGSELLLARERAVAQLRQLEAAVVASMQDEEFQVTRSELWVLKARASEHGDRAELAEITERMNRLDALLERQMIPAGEAEGAREKQKQLAARVETFDQAKARGQAGLGQIGAGNHNHARAVDLHVEPARRAVDVQETIIRQLDLQIEELTIRAPVDGLVTLISHRAGEVVPAATEIVAVVSGRPGVLLAELSEGMAAHVKVGQDVTVRSKDLFTKSFHGHVIELAPEVDEMIPRARPSPGIPAWGRRVTLQLDEGSDVLPGQAFSVALD